MFQKNQMIKSAIAGVLALTSINQAHANNAVTSPEMEKVVYQQFVVLQSYRYKILLFLRFYGK